MANVAQFDPSADHDNNDVNAINRMNLPRTLSSRSDMSSSTDTTSSSEESPSDDGSTSSSSSSSSSSTEETQTGFTNYNPSTAGEAILAANLVGAVVTTSMSDPHHRPRMPTPSSESGDNLSTFSSIDFNPSMRSFTSRETFSIPIGTRQEATTDSTAADQFQYPPSSNSPIFNGSQSASSTSNMMDGSSSSSNSSVDSTARESYRDNTKDESNRNASPGLNSRASNVAVSPWYMDEFANNENNNDPFHSTNHMIGTESPLMEGVGLQSATNSMDDPGSEDPGSEQVSSFGSSYSSTPVTPVEAESDFHNRPTPGSSGSSTSRGRMYSPRVPCDDSLSDLQNTKMRNLIAGSPTESLKSPSRVSPLYRLDETEAHDDVSYVMRALREDSLSDMHNVKTKKNGIRNNASSIELTQQSRHDSSSNEAQFSDANSLQNLQNLKKIVPKDTPNGQKGSISTQNLEQGEEVKQLELMRSLETLNNVDHITSDEDEASSDDHEEDEDYHNDFETEKETSVANFMDETSANEPAIFAATTVTLAAEDSSSGQEEDDDNSLNEDEGKYDFTSDEEESSDDEESNHNLIATSLEDEDTQKEFMARTSAKNDVSSLDGENDSFIGVINEIDDAYEVNDQDDSDSYSEDEDDESKSTDGSSSAEDQSSEGADSSETSTVASSDKDEAFSSDLYTNSTLMLNRDSVSGNIDKKVGVSREHQVREVNRSEINSDSPSIQPLSEINSDSPATFQEEDEGTEDGDFGQTEELEVEHDYQVYLSQAATNIPLAYASRSRAASATSTRTSSSSLEPLVLSEVNTDSQSNYDDDDDSSNGKSSYSSSFGPSRPPSRNYASDSPSTLKYLSEINTDDDDDDEDDDSSLDNEDDESSDDEDEE